MDWNGDGKHDWQDDAFYNNVISSTETDDDSSNTGEEHKTGVNPFIMLILIICLILELASCFD